MNVLAKKKKVSIRHAQGEKSILYGSTVMYLSFLAVERIDLLQGHGSFVLSLELVCSIIFMLCYIFSIIKQGGIVRFSNLLNQYTKIVLAFMATILFSVLFSANPALSVRRLLLLSIYVFSGLFSVNYLLATRLDNMSSIVVNAMVFSSIIYAVCSLYDVFIWFNYGMLSKISKLLPFFDSNIWSTGGGPINFVRVRGASLDPNRAGIFMIINTHIILHYCKRPTLKATICIINIAVLALTLSRTAALCFGVYIILQMMHISNSANKRNLLRKITMVFLVVVIMAGLYQIPLINEAVGHTLERFQTKDESANLHISYIQTGINISFSNIKNLLVGNGYGASADILQQGHYSNFHNAYVSFLAECGFLSVLLFIFLLVYPLILNKKQFPLFSVLVLANIPYQIFIEPYFWFILPFICVSSQLQQPTLEQSNLGIGRRKS